MDSSLNSSSPHELFTNILYFHALVQFLTYGDALFHTALFVSEILITIGSRNKVNHDLESLK